MSRIELTELERAKMAEAGRQSIACTNGWRPIETAPKTGELILVYWLNKILMANWDSDVGNWQEYPDGDFPICSDEITHWQPLPKPPQESV